MLTKNNILALSDEAKNQPAFWVFWAFRLRGFAFGVWVWLACVRLCVVFLWGVWFMQSSFPVLAFCLICFRVYALAVFALGFRFSFPLIIL
jgi:hypothetical protein